MTKAKLTGWILSGLLVAFLVLVSAVGKFVEWEGKEEMFAKIGFTTEVVYRIGIVEVVVAILFLIPRTAFVGAILLTAYLGGAVVTHVRVDEPFYFPIATGVLVWLALGLRDARVFELAFRCPGEVRRETLAASTEAGG